MAAWLANRGANPLPRDEEKDLQISLKHFDRVLVKSAGLGDYLSAIQHAHTCLLLHNRLIDIHSARQKEKAQQARRRNNHSRVAHHLLKIRQIESKRLAVPAFIHPDYKQLSDKQDVTLAAEGSSAFMPTASPASHSPNHASPHNHSPHQPQQQQQSQQQLQHQHEQQSSGKRDSSDNLLYLQPHQMAALSAMQQQRLPQQHHSHSQQQQQANDTQDIIRQLQHHATNTRQPSAPAASSTGFSPSESPKAARPPPRLPPPAYQPPTPPAPTSPTSPEYSPHRQSNGRSTGGETGGTMGTGYDRRAEDVAELDEREGGEREENGYNREGEGQTRSGPVVMLQPEGSSPQSQRGGGTSTTGYDRNGVAWKSGGAVNSPQSGKEEKREGGEGQRETTSGPILMLNAR